MAMTKEEATAINTQLTALQTKINADLEEIRKSIDAAVKDTEESKKE